MAQHNLKIEYVPFFSLSRGFGGKDPHAPRIK